MHKWSEYEKYLQDEIHRYGWESSENNEIPSWLTHELQVYYWIFRLSRTINRPLRDRNLSNQWYFRLKNIRNIRYLKYENISPELRNAVKRIADGLGELYDDLQSRKELLENKYLLSPQGVARWEEATQIVNECRNVVPNPDWREAWERKVLSPLCTRREAENIAKGYLASNGILLDLKDAETGKDKYYYRMKAKNNLFHMSFGTWGRDGEYPFKDIGTIDINMLTRDVSLQFNSSN